MFSALWADHRTPKDAFVTTHGRTTDQRARGRRRLRLRQLFLGVAFIVGLLRPERRIGLWAAGTLWLSAHALFHLWEVAVGICAPTVIPRDFPAVTLPALIGIALTLWAIRRSRAGRAAFA